MANVLVAVVNVAVVFRQQVDVMEDEAVERVVLKRLHDSSVVESTLVEHSTAGLRAHHSAVGELFNVWHTQCVKYSSCFGPKLHLTLLLGLACASVVVAVMVAVAVTTILLLPLLLLATVLWP